MIPYGCQDINEADIQAVIDVLRSDFLTQGPAVPRFEAQLADYCGAMHAVAVNSATSALHIACLALGVKPGDSVWTSPTSFVASANCALYCGASVDFVDIDPRTYNMSMECLQDKLIKAKAHGKLPKVVIPVHLCGQSCEMVKLNSLAQEFGFRVIEDASHAIGGRYRASTGISMEQKKKQTSTATSGRPSSDRSPIGSCIYSDITVFSFHPVKIITTGEGGLALTNDPMLARRMQQYRSHGISSVKSEFKNRPQDEIWNYQQIQLGYNYRITDIQAALGLSQMNRLDDFVAKRHTIAKGYDSAFSDLPVITPWQHPDTYSSYHLYPIRIRGSKCGHSQIQVYTALQQAGIAVNLHYIPIYRQPYYEAMGFKQGYCPEAELYHQEAISLPMFSSLTADQQTLVINTLVGVLSA